MKNNMKKRIFRYLKHIAFTIIVLGAIGILFGLYHGASLHYGDHPCNPSNQSGLFSIKL
tara:strand:- start:1 stop:177 length:177 start_codon:yes stop_codon:yes gene_type:complete